VIAEKMKAWVTQAALAVVMTMVQIALLLKLAQD